MRLDLEHMMVHSLLQVYMHGYKLTTNVKQNVLTDIRYIHVWMVLSALRKNKCIRVKIIIYELGKCASLNEENVDQYTCMWLVWFKCRCIGVQLYHKLPGCHK